MPIWVWRMTDRRQVKGARGSGRAFALLSGAAVLVRGPVAAAVRFQAPLMDAEGTKTTAARAKETRGSDDA